MTGYSPLPPHARYTTAGDEHLFLEIAEEMSLAANFLAMGISQRLERLQIPGVIDVCPANASLLIRFNPDQVTPQAVREAVAQCEAQAREDSSPVLHTRILEIPVWYDDPYTLEVAKNFREGFHQRPTGKDIDYAAEINGLKSAEEFIERHHRQPWIVSMVGFVAGLPFLYQLTDRDQQLEVPKYLSPRTDTPALTVGHGGCFTAIYSVQGAGGYQMLGIAAAPIFDPAQRLPDFAESMVLFRPGDVVTFAPITGEEYQTLQESVTAGTFRYRIAPIEFDVQQALNDPATYNHTLGEALA